MAADPRITRITLSALLALLLIAAPSEAAGLGTPKQVAPAEGASVAELPPFSWDPVRNADRYEFQIAAGSGFNSPVLGRGDDQFFTRNTRATLKRTVPNGRYFWRSGQATLRLHPTRRGVLVLRAVRAGFQQATYSIKIR